MDPCIWAFLILPVVSYSVFLDRNSQNLKIPGWAQWENPTIALWGQALQPLVCGTAARFSWQLSAHGNPFGAWFWLPWLVTQLQGNKRGFLTTLDSLCHFHEGLSHVCVYQASPFPGSPGCYLNQELWFATTLWHPHSASNLPFIKHWGLCQLCFGQLTSSKASDWSAFWVPFHAFLMDSALITEKIWWHDF